MLMIIYHTGYLTIPEPDVHHGRKNADFGQGFYTTPDRDFAWRWARDRKDSSTIMNVYELETEGLEIHRFERDEDWLDYILANRSFKGDSVPGADVIIGPIANDTIYDTYGIISSGFLPKDTALKILCIGAAYEQIVLKTERAAAQLRFLEAQVLDPEIISGYRALAEQEEDEFRKKFAEILE